MLDVGIPEYRCKKVKDFKKNHRNVGTCTTSMHTHLMI